MTHYLSMTTLTQHRVSYIDGALMRDTAVGNWEWQAVTDAPLGSRHGAGHRHVEGRSLSEGACDAEGTAVRFDHQPAKC